VGYQEGKGEGGGGLRKHASLAADVKEGWHENGGDDPDLKALHHVLFRSGLNPRVLFCCHGFASLPHAHYFRMSCDIMMCATVCERSTSFVGCEGASVSFWVGMPEGMCGGPWRLLRRGEGEMCSNPFSVHLLSGVLSLPFHEFVVTAWGICGGLGLCKGVT